MINTRKKQILKELDLLPLWRIKHNSAEKNQCQTTTNKLNETCRKQILQMDWQQLSTSIAQCTACSLSASRTQTVFGTGNKQASWLFISGGPEEVENTSGEPLTGPSGKLFEQMLKAIGLNRANHTYITNIVKCHLPRNRNLTATETQQCEPYLSRQIALIKPKLIIVLGEITAQKLLKQDTEIAHLRGKLHNYIDIPLIVTYHPTHLLDALLDKAKVWEDLCFAKATMQSLNHSSHIN